MATVYTIFLLIVFGVIAWRLGLLILNIAGLTGALIILKNKNKTGFRFAFATFISIMGQSYIYLAYMAFIVSWTLLRISTYDLSKIPIWIFAFLAALLPIKFMSGDAVMEDIESGGQYKNPQVEAISWTLIISIIAFFVFVFAPSVMNYLWGWVPYVGK